MYVLYNISYLCIMKPASFWKQICKILATTSQINQPVLTLTGLVLLLLSRV